jgi:hypothetical protein
MNLFVGRTRKKVRGSPDRLEIPLLIRHPPVPFLPLRADFHPKRNQARQKLATLLTSRFEDLSSDVYFELARRYPEFKEDVRKYTRSTAPTYTLSIITSAFW